MWAWLLPVAYLIGTFPSAVLIARSRGIDIRTAGSGNPGASNVTRTLGWRWGMCVMALDMAKGALAAGIGLAAGGRPAGYALGAAAVVGHVFPVWGRFRGGKGVATGGGAFCALSPVVAGVLLVVWFVVSKITNRASVASITLLILLPIGLYLAGRGFWEVLASIGLCGLVMSRHLGNIQRLASRTERTIEPDTPTIDH